MSEFSLVLELLLLMEKAGDVRLPTAAATKVAVETARAEARPAALPVSVATEATATEAAS